MGNEKFLKIIESSIRLSDLPEMYVIVEYVCIYYTPFDLICKLIKGKLEFNSTTKYSVAITVKDAEFTNISSITALHFKYGRNHIFIKKLAN